MICNKKKKKQKTTTKKKGANFFFFFKAHAEKRQTPQTPHADKKREKKETNHQTDEVSKERFTEQSF